MSRVGGLVHYPQQRTGDSDEELGLDVFKQTFLVQRSGSIMCPQATGRESKEGDFCNGGTAGMLEEKATNFIGHALTGGGNAAGGALHGVGDAIEDNGVVEVGFERRCPNVHVVCGLPKTVAGDDEVETVGVGGGGVVCWVGCGRCDYGSGILCGHGNKSSD